MEDHPIPQTTAAPVGIRRRRWCRWLAWSLVLALCFVVLAGPWHESWIERLDRPGAAPELRVRAAASHRDRPARTGPLRAGANRVDFTDQVVGLPLAGYGHRVWKPNTGAADPVAVRALVLDNGTRRVAIVTADLLLINRRLAEAVHGRLANDGWQAEDIYFSATHTHSSVGGYAGNWAETLGLGRSRPETVTMLSERIATAVRNASAACQEAEFGAGAIQVEPASIRNRTVPGGPVNRWLDVLQFRAVEGGRVLGTIVVFAAHPTCRRTSDLRLSGDYPGVLQRHLENEWGGVALFLAGPVGSMAPPADRWPRDELAESLGTELARLASRELKDLEHFERSVPLETLRVPVALPAPRVKLSAHWRLSPVMVNQFLPAETWMQGLRIGDRVLLGTPADYSGVLAQDLRNTAKPVTTIVTSFNGDYVGYVLPRDYDDLDSYEPRSMSFFGPEFGEECNRILAAMVAELSRR